MDFACGERQGSLPRRVQRPSNKFAQEVFKCQGEEPEIHYSPHAVSEP
jgi:hypothetical protein